MLFIAHKPTHLLFVPENRIILTTQTQIFFTHLHFIEEYLTLSLGESNPRLLEYSHQRSETLVASDQSIELYWSDWDHQAQLRLFLYLNSEPLYSVEYCGGWRAFGEFQQYSPKQLTLWRTQDAAEQYQSCFLGSLQYVVCRKHLVVFDHCLRKRTDIQWQQSVEYFKAIQKRDLQMKAFRLNEDTVLLQADNILLYIKKDVVLKVLSHPGVLSVSGSVVAWLQLGKIRLYSIQQDTINFHGQCDSFEGQYYGAILQENAIMMLFYEFKELKVKSIRLVHEEQNIRFSQQKQRKRKFRERYSQNLAIFQKLRQQAVGSDKIQEPQREIRSATFRINGKTIKEALKESIGKFKEQFDKSHQEEKYTQAHPESLLHNDQTQNRPYYQLDSYKSNADEKESFGRDQASREQQYEYNQDNKGLNSQNIISDHSSVASNLHEVVETPAFRMLQHSNDHWNNSSWLVYERKSEAMNPIIEEIDPEWPQSPDSIFPHQQPEATEQQSAVDIEILETNKGAQHHTNGYAGDLKIRAQAPLEHSSIPKPQDCIQLNQSSLLKKIGQDPRASCVSNRSSRKKRILSSYVGVGGSQNNSNSCNQDQENIVSSFPTKQADTQVAIALDEDQECFLRNFGSSKGQTSSQPDEQDFFNKSKVLKPVIEPEVKKYTRILAEVYRSQPQKFEEQLQKHVGSIIQEKEARLFFAQHIRNFNSDMTKDKIIRLYSFVQDTQQNRSLMTQALSEFRLDQVPSPCLSFQPNFIDIFRLICPKIYIQDLLEPSTRVVEQLIANYFKSNFSDKRIVIEGVKIELEYPRNLLNILLYLNEWLKQPLQTIFQLYTKYLLKHNYSSVISKIVESHIPQLCSIDIKVFQNAAEKALRQLLEEKIINYTVAEKILPFLNPQKRIIFNDIINLSEEFSVRGIIYDMQQLMDLPDKKDYACFLKDVIAYNSCSALSQITLPSILTQLNKICLGKRNNHYTSEAIEITKMLSEKLIENGYISEGFSNLSTVAAVLKRAYIASALFRYCKGIYANRLANTRIYTSKDFISLFKQLLFKGPRVPDKLPQHALSQIGTDKSWVQFNKIATDLLCLDCWELRYLIYTDLDLASDLVDQNIIAKSQLEACCKILGYFLSSPKKMFASQKVQECLLRLGSESASNQSGELFLVAKEGRKKQTHKKSSLRGIENKNHQDYLSKSLFASEEDTDPVLFDIKFSVVPDESIHILNEYYLQSSIEEFFDALKLVDHQKLGLKQQSISKFKAVYLQDLNYNFKSLVPFQYFFDRNQAWKKTAEHLYELDVDDFWVVYLLVQLLYGTGIEVVEVLINKVIRYLKDDSWSQSLETIIKQFQLGRPFLMNAVADAQERGLLAIQAILEQKLQCI